MSREQETARPPRRKRRLLRIALLALLLPPAFSVLQVLAVRFVDPPTTLTMLARMREHHATTGDWDHPAYESVSLEEAGPTARAFVASEDAAFFLHDGFDWRSICKAREQLARADRGKLRGGSSITQQVARNVFLFQRRSWARKAAETWYAVLLEALVPKERILELYLSVAETGPMTFGVQAGARRWFGRDAGQLTSDQAARMAAVLPNPRKWSPSGSYAAEAAATIAARHAPWPGEASFEDALREHRETAPMPLTCRKRK